MGEIGAELLRIISELPTAALIRTRDELQQTFARWHQVTRGSGRPEPQSTFAEMRKARDLVDEALRWLSKSSDDVRAYVALIEGAAGTSSSPLTRPDLSGFDPTPFLAMLPPVPTGRRPGQRRPKTRGVWVAGPGRPEGLLSGEHDHYFQLANRHAQALKLVVRDGNILSSAADVELKFAMRMREDKIQEAKIVIDRRPCAGALGCDELLPRFLPPDAVLTVYWPEGNKTYRGGHR